VAARYRVLRQTLPILSPAYEDPPAYLSSLRDRIGRAPGVVAVRDGRVAGFMTGLVLPDFLGKRTAYSPEWANAAEGVDSRIIYEEMYARLCAQWVADGCHLHAVTLLASQPGGMTALQGFGFGYVNVDAVCDLTPCMRCSSDSAPGPGPAATVNIRQAGPGDLESVTELGRGLERHMAGPPIYWAHEQRDYSAWLREPGNVLWLAFDGAQCLGMLGVQGGEPGLLILRDAGTAHIVAAFTAAGARRSGVTTALLNHTLQWARASGYQRCAVDFETMNYVAARYWLKRFQPVAYSLLRWIPE